VNILHIYYRLYRYSPAADHGKPGPPSVTGADVSALISAAAWTAERTSERDADRLLDLAFTGLTSR
jgi:hypothetical protein